MFFDEIAGKYIPLPLHNTTQHTPPCQWYTLLCPPCQWYTLLTSVSVVHTPHLGCGQLLPELLHLLPQLPDDAGVRILVHHRVVDDALSAVSIAQCGQCFLVVVGRWAHRGDHGSLTVATKVVLSQNDESQLVWLSFEL